MRIPGGDLVPARRRRRYGGGYGRRRSRNRLVLVVGVLLVAVGAAAAWYLRKDDSGVPARLAVEPTCSPTPTPTPVAPVKVAALPAPQAVTLSVVNGTNRSLLAKHVADALAAQGFHVTGQGNARTALTGPSQVVYGPGATLQARTAALWVLGASAVPNPRAPRGSVQVVLGSGFTRLATPAEAAAARRAPAPTPSSAPFPSATVLPCRS